MLYGAAVHMNLWLAVVWFVLRPAGFSPPVGWPAAAIAALTTWVVAVASILALLGTLASISWRIGCVTVLCVPLVRILVAPVALYFNRHR